MTLFTPPKQMKDKITLLAHKPWMPYVGLLLITILAAALRFYKLGAWSFWIDEIFTINHAVRHFGNIGLLLDHIPPARNWVPMSVILTAQVLNLLGINEWSARLVSVVIGVFTIPMLYFPLRKIFGNQVMLIALLLLAISPWHIFWSQNARFYTSLLLLSTLALFAFFYIIEHDRPVFLLLFYVLLYLASSERLTVFLIVPVIFGYIFSLWVLPIEKPKGLNRKTVLLSVLPLILFALLEVCRSAFLGSSLTISILDTFSGQPNTTPLRLTLSIIYRISVPVFILGLFGGIYTITTKQRAGLFVFISATLPVLLLIVLSMFMFTVDRYIFITLLPWLILCAMAVKELFFQAKRFAVLLPFGVLMIFLFSSMSDIYLYYQFQNGNRPNWKDAYGYVERNIESGDIVYTTGYQLGEYYLPAADNRYINSFEPANLAENESISYWFVIDESIGGVNPDIYSWIQDFSTLVRSEEVYLPGKSMSIRIYQYSSAHDERVDYLSER
jgi:4-amino-4-deoxy-L-arabinose transferase-like glycosyltransferase